MNILLLYPETANSFWTMKDINRLVNRKATFPPLGLLTVAAMLPKDWNIKLLDMNVKPLKKKDLLWADYVFISAMNVQLKSCEEVINLCSELGIKTVAGGPMFTHEYERFEKVDYLVLNEGEITLPQFLEDLANGTPKRIYTSSQYANVEESPLPRYDLINVNDYLYPIIQYSRGCPYLCDFCDVTVLFGRVPRTKPAGQIIRELDFMCKQGYSEMIMFADDNFIGNKRHLKNEILPALIDWRKKNKYAPAFATQLTINFADDEKLADLMLQAGFRYIFIGIETPSEESLKNCRKNQNTRRDLVSNIHYLQEKGFVVWAGFILGFDTDKEDIFKRQIDFIEQSNIMAPQINMLNAPTGTQLNERLQKEGRLTNTLYNEEISTNIIPEMGIEKLFTGYKEVINSIYDNERFYKRAAAFMLSYSSKMDNDNKIIRINRKFRFSDIFVLLKVFVVVGILSEQRKYFWKLIKAHSRRKKKNYSLPFLLATLMYQFEKYRTRYNEHYKKIKQNGFSLN